MSIFVDTPLILPLCHLHYSSPFTLHSSLFVLHPSFFTLRSSLFFFTLRSSLFVLHSSLFFFTLHSSLFTLRSSLFVLHSSFFTLRSSLFTLHSSLNPPSQPPVKLSCAALLPKELHQQPLAGLRNVWTGKACEVDHLSRFESEQYENADAIFFAAQRVFAHELVS